MSNLIKLLADSAAALDKAGMFKEADTVDDMLRSLAATLPTRRLNARQLLESLNALYAPLRPGDAGASVALKSVKDILAALEQARVQAFQEKRSGEPFRATAKDALNRILAITNSDNQAANAMFQPVVKPTVDLLQNLLRLPDNLIWS